MSKNSDRKLYIQQLYLKSVSILMEKIYKDFESYINYSLMEQLYNDYYSLNYINDTYFVFFDRLCQKIYSDISQTADLIYIILSPYHKNNVISGILATTNNNTSVNLINSAHCKVPKLYTLGNFEKYDKILDNTTKLIIKSNKIQQE